MVETMTRPIVSMAMTTYNRKKYIREALAGVFSQTYEPLEIVISDDCSTDGTWEIINEEVRKYRERRGRHSVILSRNERNLKVLGNFEKLVSMCHGELIVQCGDDDISLPNRAERTVEAWLKAGRDRVKLIHCAAERIDKNGSQMRCPIGNRDAFHPHGAVAAYSADVFVGSSNVRDCNSYEDVVYSCRAAMLGEDMTIQDVLVRYRCGDGATTGLKNWRESHVRMLERALEGCRYNLAALMSAREQLGPTRFADLQDRLLDWMKELSMDLKLHNGTTMCERYSGVTICGWLWLLSVCKGHLGNLVGVVHQILCVFPKWIGTPLLNSFARCIYKLGYTL